MEDSKGVTGVSLIGISSKVWAVKGNQGRLRGPYQSIAESCCHPQGTTEGDFPTLGRSHLIRIVSLGRGNQTVSTRGLAAWKLRDEYPQRLCPLILPSPVEATHLSKLNLNPGAQEHTYVLHKVQPLGAQSRMKRGRGVDHQGKWVISSKVMSSKFLFFGKSLYPAKSE